MVGCARRVAGAGRAAAGRAAAGPRASANAALLIRTIRTPQRVLRNMVYLLFQAGFGRRRRLPSDAAWDLRSLVHKNDVQGFPGRLSVLFTRSFAVLRFPYTWNNATTFQQFGKNPRQRSLGRIALLEGTKAGRGAIGTLCAIRSPSPRPLDHYSEPPVPEPDPVPEPEPGMTPLVSLATLGTGVQKISGRRGRREKPSRATKKGHCPLVGTKGQCPGCG